MPNGIEGADPRQPLFIEGTSGTAVLMIHGFTSTPGSMFAWAAPLAAAGHTVSVPLLEGHAGQWQDLIGVPYTSWTRTVEAEFDRLASTHKRVVVAGLSMGGALSLHVAAVRRPAAVLLVNPAVAGVPPVAHLARFLAPFLPSTPAIADDIKKDGVREGAYERTPTAAVAQLVRLQKQVRSELPGITAPITLFRSPEDHVVPAAAVRALLNGLTPATRAKLRRVDLHESYHVATLDNDLPLIVQVSLEAINEAGDGA